MISTAKPRVLTLYTLFTATEKPKKKRSQEASDINRAGFFASLWLRIPAKRTKPSETLAPSKFEALHMARNQQEDAKESSFVSNTGQKEEISKMTRKNHLLSQIRAKRMCGQQIRGLHVNSHRLVVVDHWRIFALNKSSEAEQTELRAVLVPLRLLTMLSSLPL